MLTATETARLEKFTADMDAATAQAIFRLFEHSKPGCDEATDDLIEAAHRPPQKVSPKTISTLEPYGLVLPTGDIPNPIRAAVRKAVTMQFLIMHDHGAPKLELKQLDLD